MADKRGDGDSTMIKRKDEKESWVFVSADDENVYFSQSSDESTRNGEEREESEEEEGEEMARILQEQLDRLERENDWNKAGVEALRSDLGDERGGDETKETSQMSEYEWSSFLYEWRRLFGDWGKRVLDVRQCENSDRLKAGHLLIEINRRRRALASCKAHILNLLKAAGQQESIKTAVKKLEGDSN